MEQIELLLAITGINAGALLVVAAIIWKDGRWKGRVDAKLNGLCNAVARLETHTFGLGNPKKPADEF